jgi:hypothetical protein
MLMLLRGSDGRLLIRTSPISRARLSPGLWASPWHRRGELELH